MDPREISHLSIEEKKARFRQATITHRLLEQTHRKIVRAVREPAGFTFVLAYGPTEVGRRVSAKGRDTPQGSQRGDQRDGSKTGWNRKLHFNTSAKAQKSCWGTCAQTLCCWRRCVIAQQYSHLEHSVHLIQHDIGERRSLFPPSPIANSFFPAACFEKKRLLYNPA
jgi:hypothetical protein